MLKPSLKAVRRQVLKLSQMLGGLEDKPAKKPNRKKNLIRNKILLHMAKRAPTERFLTKEFRRYVPKRPSLASQTLFNMQTSGQVRKTGPAEYQLTPMGRKQAKALGK